MPIKHLKFFFSIPLLLILPLFSMISHKVIRQNDASVNLIIRLGNVEAGSVTLSQLANAGMVSAEVINATDGTPITYAVNSYTFTTSVLQGNKAIVTYTENATGNSLSKLMKAKIANLKPGNIITIDNIKAISPQNMMVSFGATSWQIAADPTTKEK
jgi:hypothetical protein